jgi:hypothetical protein
VCGQGMKIKSSKNDLRLDAARSFGTLKMRSGRRRRINVLIGSSSSLLDLCIDTMTSVGV